MNRPSTDRCPTITDLVFLTVVNLLALMALILLIGHTTERIDLTHDRLDQIEQRIDDQHHEQLARLERIGAGR